MNTNILYWIVIALFCAISSIALVSTIAWASKEDDKKKAFMKMNAAVLLFVAISFVLAILCKTVYL